MKLLLKILSILFLAQGAWTQTTPNTDEKNPPSIVIGVLPGGNLEHLREQSLELAKELQNTLHIPVNIFVSKNYAGLIEAMKAKKVDFAFFSAMTFVAAEEQAGAKVLLKKVWQEPYYFSAIISPTQKKLKKLTDLKGKKIAFVDENSTSGFLYPRVALRKAGLKKEDFKEVVFSGNHQASIQFLEAGTIDAAAVFSDDQKGNLGAWKKLATKKNQKYQVIWISEPIPNDPFCVRQDFYDLYPKVTHNLMFALVDLMNEGKNRDKFTEILGSRDLIPATSKQYDPVREMVKTLNIEVKP